MLNKDTIFVQYLHNHSSQFCSMDIHIGGKIKDVFNQKGMTVSEFSRRLNMSRENVYSVFKRKTIDTGLLSEISAVLEYDFFMHYTSLGEQVESLKKENELLREMCTFLKEKSPN